MSCLVKTDKKFQADINRDNPLGFGGSLAIAFAIILRQLWSGQRDSIEPSHLKTLLANRASQFSGYAQHDAQEFMAFLLDGLHEVRDCFQLNMISQPNCCIFCRILIVSRLNPWLLLWSRMEGQITLLPMKPGKCTRCATIQLSTICFKASSSPHSFVPLVRMWVFK